jgi:hypothetical protein
MSAILSVHKINHHRTIINFFKASEVVCTCALSKEAWKFNNSLHSESPSETTF